MPGKPTKDGTVYAEFDKEAPAVLIGDAIGYWKKYVEILISRGTLVAGDEFALERLCFHKRQWRKMAAHVDEHGMFEDGASDRGAPLTRKTKQAQEMQIAEDKIAALEKRFGLTPQERSGVKGVGKKKAESGMRGKY